MRAVTEWSPKGSTLAEADLSRHREISRGNVRGHDPLSLARGWDENSVDLFEYQARDMFEKHGVPVLAGIVADTPAEVRAAAEKLGGVTVVKAQVKTGGRGKAGGVKVAKTADDAEAAGPSPDFLQAVERQAVDYCQQGLPVRAGLFMRSLHVFYQTPEPLNSELYAGRYSLSAVS